MSPLKLSLLLRAYSMPRPNQDLPEAQAYAPAMIEAINSLRMHGLLKSVASASTMRLGYAVQNGTTFGRPITQKGEALAKRILESAADFYKEAGDA